MDRRHLLACLGLTIVWPLVASAQQVGKVHRVGYLSLRFPAAEATRFTAQAIGTIPRSLLLRADKVIQ
jgi:hypothetical protein